MKKLFFFIFTFSFFPCLIFGQTFPLEVTYPRFGPIVLPSFTKPDEFLPRYIDYIYQVSTIAFSILALFSLILGGVLYFSSFGSVSKQIEARERILNALLGILILGSSFLLLRSLHQRFTRIELAQLHIPFDEIEGGVWLCNEEMKVKDPYLSEELRREVYFSFEQYLYLKELLSKDWKEKRMDPKIEKMVATLIKKIREKCLHFTASGEISPDFRYPSWLYIVGNFGAILHTFPNFKGYCGLPYLISGKIDFKSAYQPANQAYRDLVLGGQLQTSDSNLAAPSFAFEVANPTLPKYTITLFSDFRLNYADHLLNIQPSGPYPQENETTTITFYTFRNFHEDLPPQYQQTTSTCPRLSEPFEQNCLIEINVNIKDYFGQNPIQSQQYSLGTTTFQARTISIREKWESIDLDSCYSFQIKVPEEKEGNSWVVIIYPPSQTVPTITEEVLTKPFFWCDIFGESDRNLENNYTSYFCEDKIRQKRYPCVGLVSFLPGKILRIEEKRH